ncbi:S-adenosylmethionine decarboxylase [Globomyces pollinis-pini]|nr:S-adenosylmethionine decarboxylase [Globomyces pollinis-pini]
MSSKESLPSAALMNSQIYNSNESVDMSKLTLSGFEGPEKLLEIWFTAPPKDWKNNVVANLDDESSDLSDCEKPLHPYTSNSFTDSEGQFKYKRSGLRTVNPAVWEDMLKIVQCQVLSTAKNEFVDAYLLSESSMFVYSNRLILKTCGTTTLLHSIPRILSIAEEFCHFDKVEAIFYSRKSFLFPERQEFPHGKWGDEVAYLDNIFPSPVFDTAGYVIGKVNGDHWCLYLGTPNSLDVNGNLDISQELELNEMEEVDDITLEILMTDLDPAAMKEFWRTAEEHEQAKLPHNIDAKKHRFDGVKHRVYNNTGIADIYPKSVVDDYTFDPCGYSANGLLGPYYYTIHVTPESICSYASFETTIPVKSFFPKNRSGVDAEYSSFNEVIQKVVDVFQPGKFSTTLFVHHHLKSELSQGLVQSPLPGFRTRDRITHSLGRWELVFSHFEKTGNVNPRAGDR